jgi:hypothetical protein
MCKYLFACCALLPNLVTYLSCPLRPHSIIAGRFEELDFCRHSAHSISLSNHNNPQLASKSQKIQKNSPIPHFVNIWLVGSCCTVANSLDSLVFSILATVCQASTDCFFSIVLRNSVKQSSFSASGNRRKSKLHQFG